eukprot:12388594-Alexandrium_andersonii.AAC.1
MRRCCDRRAFARPAVVAHRTLVAEDVGKHGAALGLERKQSASPRPRDAEDARLAPGVERKHLAGLNCKQGLLLLTLKRSRVDRIEESNVCAAPQN